MANLVQAPGSVETLITSVNVTAPTYTADQFGNLTYSAGGLLQYACIKFDAATGNPYDIIPAAANNMPIGVMLDAGVNGTPAVGPGIPVAVQVTGVTKCRAFSAISVGDALNVADAAGRVATITMTGGATDTPIVGFARTPATQIDDFVEVELRIGSYTTVTS